MNLRTQGIWSAALSDGDGNIQGVFGVGRGGTRIQNKHSTDVASPPPPYFSFQTFIEPQGASHGELNQPSPTPPPPLLVCTGIHTDYSRAGTSDVGSTACSQ